MYIQFTSSHLKDRSLQTLQYLERNVPAWHATIRDLCHSWNRTCIRVQNYSLQLVYSLDIFPYKVLIGIQCYATAALVMLLLSFGIRLALISLWAACCIATVFLVTVPPHTTNHLGSSTFVLEMLQSNILNLNIVISINTCPDSFY